MVDVVLSNDVLTVLGGPASVNVDVDLGTPGKRGSIILASPGIPTSSTIGGVQMQEYDTVVNVVPGNEYLAFYQYLNVDGELQWQYIFQLSNNSYSRNAFYTFASGQAEVSIPFSEIVAYGIIANLSEVNFNIQSNFVYPTPVASSISGLEIVRNAQNDAISLDFTITGLTFDPVTGAPVPLNGEIPVYLFISVI